MILFWEEGDRKDLLELELDGLLSDFGVDSLDLDSSKIRLWNYKKWIELLEIEVDEVLLLGLGLFLFEGDSIFSNWKENPCLEIRFSNTATLEDRLREIFKQFSLFVKIGC